MVPSVFFSTVGNAFAVSVNSGNCQPQTLEIQDFTDSKLTGHPVTDEMVSHS